MNKKDLPTWKELFPFYKRWKNRLKLSAIRKWLISVTDARAPARGVEYAYYDSNGKVYSSRLPTLDEYEEHVKRTPQYLSIKLRKQAERYEEAFGRSEDSIELLQAAELLESYYSPCKHQAERLGYITGDE